MTTMKWTYRIYETKMFGKNMIAIDVLYKNEWYRWNFCDYSDPTDLKHFDYLVDVLTGEGNNTEEIIFTANVDDSNIKDCEVLNDDEDYKEYLNAITADM